MTLDELDLEPYVPDLSLPRAIVVDVDGTTALHVDRGPFDYERVGEDLPNEPVIELVRLYENSGCAVVFMSGREDIGNCHYLTEMWLRVNVVPDFWLFMRAEGDDRPDFQVKYELFNKHVRNDFNVLACIDDRKQVIDMYRRIGLPVWDVAGNTF